jgi:type II secretory ATPase GspE/PulE/Tfp pilus assembly ATPase PilB-like protein
MSRSLDYLQSAEAQERMDIPFLVNCIVYDAIQAGASDIHLEPWEGYIEVRIRLNGVLSELIRLPLELNDKIAGRFKVMANLITYQTDLPQEGHAAGGPELNNVELRISVFPTVRGEKIVVRLFDMAHRSFDIHSLGFEPDTLKKLLQLLARPNGMLLLTGPTGSGKTTAIYSALAHLVQRSGTTISISTVEDPVEFSLQMVSQAQVNPAHDFTYPIALRSLMRQDPQVIMIGEIRDPETANIAVQAGLTGHLVISTIHSGSATGVFARLMNMQIEPFLLASSIVGVLGIRLIRTNCPNCAQPTMPDPAYLKLLPPQLAASGDFRKGAGCEHCLNTGYSGRAALTELLIPDEVFREAVLLKKPTSVLNQLAIERGMQTLWQNGLRRVLSGQTTLDEVFRAIALDQV